MLIDFIDGPPGSHNVICSVEAPAVPPVYDCVSIDGVDYFVRYVEWIVLAHRSLPNEKGLGSIVYLRKRNA
jgi:hypothetical protein